MNAREKAKESVVRNAVWDVVRVAVWDGVWAVVHAAVGDDVRRDVCWNVWLGVEHSEAFLEGVDDH